MGQSANSSSNQSLLQDSPSKFVQRISTGVQSQNAIAVRRGHAAYVNGAQQKSKISMSQILKDDTNF